MEIGDQLLSHPDTALGRIYEYTAQLRRAYGRRSKLCTGADLFLPRPRLSSSPWGELKNKCAAPETRLLHAGAPQHNTIKASIRKSVVRPNVPCAP